MNIWRRFWATAASALPTAARIALMLICADVVFLPTLGGARSGKEDLLKEARAAFERRDYDLAISRLGDAIKVDPNDAQAWIYRCRAYEAKGNYQRAMSDCDTAVRLAPLSAEAHRYRSDTYLQDGKIEQALADADQAIKLDPDDPRNYRARGSANYFRGRYDAARSDFDEALRLNPKDSNAFAMRGNVFFHLRDYDRAWDDYNKAIEVDPKNPFAFTCRGYAEAAFFHYDEAIENYDAAIALDPSDKAIRLYRARAYSSRRWMRLNYFTLSLLGLGLLSLVLGAWRVFRSPTAFQHSTDRRFRRMEDGRLIFYSGRKRVGYEVPDADREKQLRQFVRRSWSASMLFGPAFLMFSLAAGPVLSSAIRLISTYTELRGMEAIALASCAFTGLFFGGAFFAIRSWSRAAIRGLAIAPEKATPPPRNQWISDLILDMPVWARRAVFAGFAWLLVVGILQLVRNPGPLDAMLGPFGRIYTILTAGVLGWYLIKAYRIARTIG